MYCVGAEVLPLFDLDFFRSVGGAVVRRAFAVRFTAFKVLLGGLLASCFLGFAGACWSCFRCRGALASSKYCSRIS